jgi:uncharacterized protein (TIRG00374 family)
VLSDTPPRTSNGGWSSPAAVLFFRLLRFAVVAALLYYAVYGVDWHEAGRALAEASPTWLVVAGLLTVLDRMTMAWRWIALLRAVDANRPLRTGPLLRVFFVSGFAGTFIPAGSFGGDTVRAVAATRQGVTMANAVASVALDRLLGTISVLLSGVVGIMLLGRLEYQWLLWVAGVLGVGGAIATWLLLFDSRVYRLMLQRTGLSRIAVVDRLAHKFLDAVGQYANKRGVLAAVLAGSVFVHVLRTLQVWALGMALGLTVPLIWYFAAVPLIVLIMLLPLGPNGIGSGNAAFVWLFGVADVPRDPAFMLSVLFILLAVIGNLPGGLLLAFKSKDDQREG